MSQAWRKERLGNVCRVIPGYAFKSSDWQKDGIPVVKIKNIKGDGSVDISVIDCVPESLLTQNNRKYVLENGDILVAMTGATAGKVGKVRTGKPLLLNQRVAKIDPVDADHDFIWSVVSSDEYQEIFYKLADGAAQPNMSGSQIESVEIPFPPLPIQRRIAYIILAYDELIANNQRRILILEDMARSLYREWFVHFRYPGHESVILTDSSLGPIPQGWEYGRLDEVLVLQRGFDLPKDEREDGAVPIIAATGINGFHSTAKVKAPGVVTGRSGSLGDVLYVYEDFWPLNTTLWVKEFPKSEPLFAYYLLSSLELKQFNSGAAVPTLNRNDVHGVQVVIPPRELQRKFQANAGAMLEQAQLLQRQTANLRRTRDLLLPRLLSGQVILPADTLAVTA